MIFITRTPEIRQRAIDYILSLDKVQQIDIGDEKKSGNQERFFHSLCGVIAKFTGDDKEEVKLQIKYRVLPLHEIHANGNTYLVPKSTTRLTKQEYSQLIDAAMMLGQSLQLQMPLAKLHGVES